MSECRDSSFVDVKENINRIESSINKMKNELKHFEKQVKFTNDEILRLEGCLIVFKGFNDAGITSIDPKNNKCNTNNSLPQVKAEEKKPSNPEEKSVEKEAVQVHNHHKEKEEENDDDTEEALLSELYKKYRVG